MFRFPAFIDDSPDVSRAMVGFNFPGVRQTPVITVTIPLEKWLEKGLVMLKIQFGEPMPPEAMGLAAHDTPELFRHVAVTLDMHT